MKDPIIYQVALDVPLRRLFDYLPSPTDPSILPKGTRVKVPFGRSHRVGIVMGQQSHSAFSTSQLKAIDSVLDEEPLFPEELCEFIEKTAQYYHHPIGEVTFTGVPLAIRLGKPCEPLAKNESTLLPSKALTLHIDQQNALDAILAKQDTFASFLLEGITGSGKTEVYLQVAAAVLSKQKQVLILVPEISLTPQTQERFIARFGDVICFHSRMTPKQRLQAWLKVRHQQAHIIIGTRSAIFLPFVNLGLIVIDEEHDASFKQQEGFRYLARDVAVLRAQKIGCPIILGSATPSFETINNAQSGKYHWLKLPVRATSATLPEMILMDVRHNKLEAGLSNALIKEIEDSLKKNQQVLLFINRRGFSPTFMCYGCGWLAECERCDSRLTFHHKKQMLICHHCLHQRPQPHACPQCQSGDLNPVGQGTERLENFLMERFPDISLARIDSDSTRKKGSLEELLEKAKNKEAQLLIGTQMLAKGHHFPHLGMVAIVDADGGLFSVDFRSIERMAQLIIQVAGRAGRVHDAGRVIIQTFHPDEPLLQHILHQDYAELAKELLLERQRSHLPPFSHLALIRASANNPALPETLLKEVQQALRTASQGKISILGPVPAPMLKRQGQFRFQLLVQASERKPLHQLLHYSTTILENSKLGKKVRWSLDVDPIEMF
jgi:primosomal protein N' (replication factor Y)